MHLFRNKKNQSIISIVISVLFVSFASAALLPVSGVFADACGHDLTDQAKVAGGCDETNWRDAQKGGFSGSKQEFNALRDRCQGTDSVNSNGPGKYLGNGYSTDTQGGNCSNAIKSCYQSATDTRACSDPNVLALIASCEEGNVGASGASFGGAPATSPLLGGQGMAGCGVDNAISSANYMKGTQYKTNGQTVNDYRDGIAAKECKQTNDADMQKCKDDLLADIYQCEYEKGYVQKTDGKDGVTFTDGSGQGFVNNTKIDTKQLNECVAGRAKDEPKCTARGGTWDAAAKKCNPPKAATTAKDCTGHGGGQPDADGKCPDGSRLGDAECLKDGNGKCIGNGTFDKVNGECGEAKTNIISCGTDTGATALSNVLRIFVMVLSFGVGIAALGGLAYSAVQYAGASDSEGNVSAARERIRNIVIGLVLYGFLIAIANWLVPGGIF